MHNRLFTSLCSSSNTKYKKYASCFLVLQTDSLVDDISLIEVIRSTYSVCSSRQEIILYTLMGQQCWLTINLGQVHISAITCNLTIEMKTVIKANNFRHALTLSNTMNTTIRLMADTKHWNEICMIIYDMIRYDMIWYDTVVCLCFRTSYYQR